MTPVLAPTQAKDGLRRRLARPALSWTEALAAFGPTEIRREQRTTPVTRRTASLRAQSSGSCSPRVSCPWPSANCWMRWRSAPYRRKSGSSRVTLRRVMARLAVGPKDARVTDHENRNIGMGWVGSSVAISTLHSGTATELLVHDHNDALSSDDRVSRRSSSRRWTSMSGRTSSAPSIRCGTRRHSSTHDASRPNGASNTRSGFTESKVRRSQRAQIAH